MAQSDLVIFVPDGEALRGLRLIHRPDPVTALEKQEYEQARAALALPAPSPEPPVCLRHDWNPARPFPGAPRPPMAECPECKRETDHLERKAPEHGYDHRELPAPEDVKRTPTTDRAWHQHLAEQEAAGVVIAGSLLEERAIDRADALRAKAIARDHPKARVAFERIEGGRVVQYHHPQRKRKSRGGASWHESDYGEITVET